VSTPVAPRGAVAGTTGELPPASTAGNSAGSPSNSPADPASATQPTGGAAVATTGVATSTGTINGGLIVGAIGVKNLDPEVRRQLEEFRLHVELFFAATTMNLEAETAR
jgi:hypothetical protein